MKKIMLLLLLLCATANAQKPVFSTAKVEAATVYFNAAEITQTATANLPAGTSEIVVKNVADYLNEGTVQVGTPAWVTVLSVQFTRDYISEYELDETSPGIKKVRDSIRLVQKELSSLLNKKASEQKTIELLDRNNQVYGQQSGLSVAELMKMVEYYKAKRTETADAINVLSEKEQKFNEVLARLNNRLQANVTNSEKMSSGKLVLQVMNDKAGNVPLSISYLTGNASWTPFYDLRADNTSGPLSMMYKAQVVQQTGIDWKKAKLTLSSGTPNQNNTAPLLNAWMLRFGGMLQSLNGQVAGLAINTYSSAPAGDIVQEQSYKLKSSISDYTSISENQLSISFNIDIPYDILSNGKAHSVSLKEIKLPATYKHYAVPKLDQDAFLLAEITDYSKYNLLRGEANIIFEGMYIGKTFIDPSQTTDTLSLSMGRDRKISIKREKIAEKSGTKFLSSYKEQTFTYETVVRNNKKEAITLTLKDQYPLSTDKDIEIELLDDSRAKVNAALGILNWELKLEPGETKKVRISYRIKYPKNKPIINL